MNHSIWLGSGSFHTNTIEGLWSTIKRISDNFSDLNFKLFDDLSKQGIKVSEYIDDWICYCLFYRDIARRKLTDYESKLYLIECLKN